MRVNFEAPHKNLSDPPGGNGLPRLPSQTFGCIAERCKALVPGKTVSIAVVNLLEDHGKFEQPVDIVVDRISNRSP